MTEDSYRPGQKLRAKVEGIEHFIYLSLSTEEKGDRRDFCWRYAPPSNEIVPKAYEVEILGTVPMETPYANTVRRTFDQ